MSSLWEQLCILDAEDRRARFLGVFELGNDTDLGDLHRNTLSDDDFAKEMRVLSLATIFDLAKHGSNLSDHIFHD